MPKYKRGTHATSTKGASTKLPKCRRPQGTEELTGKALLDAIGIDRLCEWMAKGCLNPEIVRDIDCGHTALWDWIAATPERTARARQARNHGAFAWDMMAADVLDQLPDDATQGQIARARELASHYRWRAKALGRADYGESVAVTGAGGGPLQMAVSAAASLTDEQLLEIAAKGAE